MSKKFSIAPAIVVQWDSGEARFYDTRSAQNFINKICKRIAPDNEFGILGAIAPVGFQMTGSFPEIKGILTDCCTNEDHEVKLRYGIEEGVFYLIGGPTGCESFSIGSRFTDLNRMCEKGWCACMGTKPAYDELGYLIAPGYDRLVISAAEMKKVIPRFLTNQRS